MTNKSNSAKTIFNFFTTVTVVLFTVYFLHLFILGKYNLKLNESILMGAYFANYILVIVIYTTLYLLKNKYKDQLGYLFMFSSLLKFGVFFIFFYPIFNVDDKITKLEFTAFFCPYAIALIIETVALIRLMNPKEKSD